MRNFTLLFSLFLCVAGANAQGIKPAKKALAAPMRKVMKAKRTTRAEELNLWMPGKEELFFYEDEEYLPMASTTFTYYKDGNIKTETVNDEGSLARTTYTYDENNNKIEEVSDFCEEGDDEWILDTKTTYTYDPIVTDLMTSKYIYTWDDAAEDWVQDETAQAQTRTVTRDAKGNITSIEVKAYFSHIGDWDIVQRTDITYDEKTNKAIAFDYRQSEYDENFNVVYGEPTSFKNIEWESTDGQITADYLTECLFGANRFKSADVTLIDGEDTYTAHISVEYTNGGDDVNVTCVWTDGETDIDKYTAIDENGSYLYTSHTYMDEELYEATYTVQEIDEYGNLTLYEEGMLTEDGDREPEQGERYTYTYDDEKDVVTEILAEAYAYYEPEEGESGYEPAMKFVYSDFVDVLSAINKVSTGMTGDATTIFNLQGVAVGRDTKNLPAGLYIIKQGGRVQKMLKK